MGGKRSPRSGQKRRGGPKRRVDYATLEALADLQYEMNKGASHCWRSEGFVSCLSLVLTLLGP